MADAAKADDQAAIAQVQDGKQAIAAGTADGGESIDTSGAANNPNNPINPDNPDSTRVGTDERSREMTAADAISGASATIVAGAQDNGANTLPKVEANAAQSKATMLGQAANAISGASATIVAGAQDNGANTLPKVEANAAQSKATMLGQAANARGGVTRVKSGAARAAGRDNASTVTTDPVALAMLLAASGMQMNSGAGGASSAIDGANTPPVNAAGGRKPAIVATGVANALAVSASAEQAHSAQPARDAPPALLDAASSALSAGAGLPGALAASQGKTENFDSSAAQPSIMMESAGLPELVRSFATTATLTPVVEATISVPVASGAWPHAVAAQVHWLVNNDVQSATLRLSPEHLGPVEVQIDVRHSQVNVNFSAAHAETRVALEQTVPRLREIFASGGLTLGEATVQQDPRPGSQPNALPVRSALAHAQTVEPVAVAAAHALGLVDEYV
jgi:flagellar hook-length control protein FliK